MTVSEPDSPVAPQPTTHRRKGGSLLRVTASLLVVVLIVLVAGIVVELVRGHTANEKEKAGKAALAAAVSDFPKVSSYSYATIAADMARAKSVFTPALQKDYTKLFGTLVSTLQQQKVVVTSTVQQAQTISIDSPDSVRVLIFFTQQTSKPSATAPTVTPGGYALTMTKLNGKWLIGAANAAA